MPLFPHILTTLLAIARFRGIAARGNGFRHEAVDASDQHYERRVEKLDPLIFDYTISEQCPAPTRSVHSLLYPSPNASAVEITIQSQVVTSYLPEMTWCVGPPVAFAAITTRAPYLNQSVEYEMITAGTARCETAYATTETTVCATTLTGIASKITVSECDQEITFSSECGFTLETPTPVTSNSSLITPAPTVKRLTTFWVAPWQSLTAGEAPSDVDIKVCTAQEDESLECLRYREVWEVFVVTKTMTTRREVQLTTTVTGPGTLIVETMTAIITDAVETIDLSTTLLLETGIETESTSKRKKLVTRPNEPEASQASVASELSEPSELDVPTLYITKHVKYKTPKPEPTTTIHITSVARVTRTITRTRPRSRPRPTLLELPDF
ncbi:hypothetical protein P171DRAFT_435335 [Karstenula rhodostoma CBS 690.94]|uniref:Ig-like domain-containing protein n=1 Tax=Karstenula rhodostoma CBS 690.94 TaxID=1392251 RepID=A0A9P4U8Z2_9PLEO|nr:hypothetical protein P171DRAFT_435335 [Karstenula rhodostoma CBS 690.94]